MLFKHFHPKPHIILFPWVFISHWFQISRIPCDATFSLSVPIHGDWILTRRKDSSFGVQASERLSETSIALTSSFFPSNLCITGMIRYGTCTVCAPCCQILAVKTIGTHLAHSIRDTDLIHFVVLIFLMDSVETLWASG